MKNSALVWMAAASLCYGTLGWTASRPMSPRTFCVDDTCITTEPEEPRQNGGVKWHPGHYQLPDMVMSANNKLSNSVITELASEPAVKGLQLKVFWAMLEPTRGNYDFSELEEHLEQLEKIGKRYVIQVMDRTFATSTSASGALPAYLATEPGAQGGWVAKPKGGVVARLWVPAVMDRLIALHTALATRFDDEPHFEGIVLSESEVGFTEAQGPVGFSYAALHAQYERLYRKMPTVWTRTNVFTFINYFQTQDRVSQLIELAYQNRLGLGGPDIKLTEGTLSWAQNVLIGKVWNGSAWVKGGKDYRGKMPVGFAQQVLDPSGLNATPTLVYESAVDANPWSLASSHIFWSRHSSAGPEQNWTTGCLPYLRRNPQTVVSCPANYKNGCDAS